MSAENSAWSAEHPRRDKASWLQILWVAFVLLLGVILILPAVLMRNGSPSRKVSARRDVASVTAALRQYLTKYETLPQGTHRHVMAALRGQNRMRILFFEAATTSFNALGELLDPWKTPHAIDVSDPAKPRVHSFGPDRKDDHGAPESDDIASWRRAVAVVPRRLQGARSRC